MASADKSSVADQGKESGGSSKTAIEFLPDADEIERRPLPLAARVTLHVLLAALLSFIVWAILSEVDMIVVARGRLSATVPNIVVQPIETSIVQTVNVRAGQVVHKGDKLATLDPTFAAADESQLRSKLESLNTQWASIDAALNGHKNDAPAVETSDRKIQDQLANERQASYLQQIRRQSESIARLRSSLDAARRDEQSQNARANGLRELENMTDDLVSKKLAVRSRLLDARDRLLEAERAAEAARSHQAELRRELAAMEAEKSAFEASWRQKMYEELLAVSRERDAVKDQLQKASLRQNKVILTAPVDAIVLEVGKFSQGSIVREAEAVVTLVPLGAELEAEVQIDSQDVGYLKAGSQVHVKVDAFPFQKHGMLEGSLRTYSQDSFRREPGGTNITDTFYAGRITMKNAKLDRLPVGATLLPGMTLSAEILVGKRSVMSYMLWPLTKATSESIREP
jgi:HlyD family secretion protein